jgi:uridylate kinase
MYKRVLLKLSGEALMGTQNFGYQDSAVEHIVKQVKEIYDQGIEVAVVIGGGNICRGKSLSQHGLELATADYMGMMATLMNAMYLQDRFKNIDVDTRVMSAIEVKQLAEPFIRLKALKHFSRNRLVILACGTGNPFCTTDTAASLKAKELNCEVLIKATKVDGIYDKDPNKFSDAVKYEKVSFDEVIQKKLEVMDATAFTMCRDFDIPIIVTDIMKEGALTDIIQGKSSGTIITS